jgi:hypothetical protein
MGPWAGSLVGPSNGIQLRHNKQHPNRSVTCAVRGVLAVLRLRAVALACHALRAGRVLDIFCLHVGCVLLSCFLRVGRVLADRWPGRFWFPTTC